jgi:hypothetical protein
VNARSIDLRQNYVSFALSMYQSQRSIRRCDALVVTAVLAAMTLALALALDWLSLLGCYGLSLAVSAPRQGVRVNEWQAVGVKHVAVFACFWCKVRVRSAVQRRDTMAATAAAVTGVRVTGDRFDDAIGQCVEHAASERVAMLINKRRCNG